MGNHRNILRRLHEGLKENLSSSVHGVSVKAIKQVNDGAANGGYAEFEAVIEVKLRGYGLPGTEQQVGAEMVQDLHQALS